MPVKVRCPDCAKALNAPDKARGKALKCPACGGRVKVPRGSGAEGPPKKRRPRPKPPADPDDIFSGVDLRNAEDERTKICPKCAKFVGEEHEECPYCGVNVDTGVLSERQQRRRSNQGPDRDEFFQNVWKNSMKFVKQNKSLVYRTMVNWTLTLTLTICCAHITQWCYAREIVFMQTFVDNVGVTFEPGRTVITGDPNARGSFMGKKYGTDTILPSLTTLAHQSPVVNFWRALTLIFALGFAGWGLFLAKEIITATMRGERKLKRVQGDFFGNITLGIRAYVWPLFIFLPVPWLLVGFAVARGAMGGVLSQNEAIFIGVGFGAAYLLSLFLLPPALVHWSQKHTYPAWLIVNLFKNFAKTMRASLAMTGMMILTCFLLPIGVAVGVAVAWGPIFRAFGNMMASIAGAIGGWGTASSAGGGFFDFVLVELPVFAVVVCICMAIVFGIVAFPAVYMMRALGLYGLYFRNELDLVPETTAFDAVGFGPRYLASCVDGFITALVLSLIGVLQSFAFSFVPAFASILVLVQFGFLFMYYMTSETGQARATPGKWSLGLLVLTDKNEPMDRSTGSKRTLCAFLTTITFYLGFLMCLFDPEKRAMHDKMSGTRVCWKGDDERT